MQAHGAAARFTTCAGAQIVVENLSAHNATILNGAAIAGETTLRSGDVLTLADRSFRFERGARARGC